MQPELILYTYIYIYVYKIHIYVESIFKNNMCIFLTALKFHIFKHKIEKSLMRLELRQFEKWKKWFSQGIAWTSVMNFQNYLIKGDILKSLQKKIWIKQVIKIIFWKCVILLIIKYVKNYVIAKKYVKKLCDRREKVCEKNMW